MTNWTKTSKNTSKWYKDKTIETSAPKYNDSSITYDDVNTLYPGRDISVPIGGPDDTSWSKTSKNTTVWD
jgi:hypothetical protein